MLNFELYRTRTWTKVAMFDAVEGWLRCIVPSRRLFIDDNTRDQISERLRNVARKKGGTAVKFIVAPNFRSRES